MNEIEQAYLTLHKACTIEPGDTVMVREWQHGELGYRVYPSNISIEAGIPLKVIEKREDEYVVEKSKGFGEWFTPFFALTLVKKRNMIEVDEYLVKFLEDGDIKIGCKTIPFEKLKEIVEFAND